MSAGFDRLARLCDERLRIMGEQEAEIERLRAVIKEMLAETHGNHDPAWANTATETEGKTGKGSDAERVTAEEVEKFLDLIRQVSDARERGSEAENELLWELLGMVAARTEFFINPVGGPLFDSNGEQLIDENTGVDDSIWVEIPVNLFNVLRKLNERMGGDG